jgi:tetratricopeptide (TPR) repeat protein
MRDRTSRDRRREWEQLLSAYTKNSDDNAAYTIELAREYLRKHPRRGSAWVILGERLADVARYDEAHRALRKAMTHIPDTWRHVAFIGIAHLYREKGNHRVAERWYRRALAAKPRDAGYHIFLGACLAKQGKLTEAKRHHRRAIALGTGCTDEAHLNLALILRAEGKYRDALAHLDRAIALDPKYAPAKEARRDVVRVLELRAR